MRKETCYICGDEADEPIRKDGQIFCCETCLGLWEEMLSIDLDEVCPNIPGAYCRVGTVAQLG